MIVDVAVRYKAKVKRHRGRDFRLETFSCVVPVEVRELSASEAPVAVRYDEPLDPHARHARHEVRPVVLRDVCGRLGRVVQARDGDGRTVRETCDGAWLAQVSSQGDRTSPGPFRELAGWHGHEPAPLIEDVRISAVESSDRMDVLARAHAVAAGLALVDGVLWQACEEPRLVVEGDPMDRNLLRGWVRHRVGSDRSDPSKEFRLDQADLATRLNHKLVDYGFRIEMPRIEVVMPELLRLRTTEALLASAAEQLAEWMGRDLKTKPLSYMTAFAGLREALPSFRAAVEGDPDFDVEGLVTLLEATLQEHRRVEGDGGATPQAASAARRWREASQEPGDVATLMF